MKDDFLANLIGGSRLNESVSKVIDITDCGHAAPLLDDSSVSSAERPSMMDMMIAAHKEAKNTKDLLADEQVKKTTESFGKGFKKGFMSSGRDSNTQIRNSLKGGKKKTEKELYISWMQKELDCPVDMANLSCESKSNVADTNKDPKIVTLKGKKKHEGSDSLGETATSMIAEVRKAISDEEPSILKQLKQGDWVTPSLLAVLQENKIIKAGLSNPRCSAALQQMQSDPKEAKKRFQNDPEVDLFMREFGKVMSGHFDGLGKEQCKNQEEKVKKVPTKISVLDQSNNHSSKSDKTSRVGDVVKREVEGEQSVCGTSVGVLQAEALKKHRSAVGGSSSSFMSHSKVDKGKDCLTEEEKQTSRVQEIIRDEELSSLLMDVKFQQVLKECGDPVKYRAHMSNKDTARKLKKMFDAGLVATAM